MNKGYASFSIVLNILFPSFFRLFLYLPAKKNSQFVPRKGKIIHKFPESPSNKRVLKQNLNFLILVLYLNYFSLNSQIDLWFIGCAISAGVIAKLFRS